MSHVSYRASKLAEHLAGRLEGEDVVVTRLALPGEAASGVVVVVTDPQTIQGLPGGQAAVLVLAEGLGPTSSGTHIYVQDPRLALARLSRLFDARPQQAEGIHPSAVVHPSARLAGNVRLDAGVVVGAGAKIGNGCTVGAHSIIGRGAMLGEGCLVHANVTLYDGVSLGRRVILHSGVVVGGDGFGYASGPRGAEKIHHLGSVDIDDDVEIGANSCIDRGTLGPTRIGPRTKIDNLCQIGHNVQIGSDCLIAGLVGIAGSTVLGRRVTIGGSAGIADHLSIGDGARIAGRAGVTKNVPAGETWAGFPAAPYKQWVRGLYLQGRLERIWAFVKGAGIKGAEETGRD